MSQFSAYRIHRAIAKAYEDCRSLVAEIREYPGDTCTNRSRLERIAMHRDFIADRRRSLECGGPVLQTGAHYASLPWNRKFCGK